MFRFKRLFGGCLWARGLATQCTEAVVKCAVLNRLTQLGMPETVRVVSNASTQTLRVRHRQVVYHYNHEN